MGTRLEALEGGDLRRWQTDALEAWLHASRRGVVEVATGGGKTRFAMACIRALGEDAFPVQVIVPTVALADQWFVALQEDMGVASSDLRLLTSKHQLRAPARYNITVINTARNLSPSLWGKRGRFLIVDECHRAGSPSNAAALAGPTHATLGLSATPERQYDDFFASVIQPALGDIVYVYTLTEASQDGVLSGFRLHNVRTSLVLQEQREYEDMTRRIGLAASSGEGDRDARLEHLLRLRSGIANRAIARVPTAVKLLEMHRGERSIVFHESIDAADSIAALLRSRSHSAAIYHSRIGGDLRRENLRLFRRGVYDSLVTCRALDEGINVPEATVAVIAAATASDRQRVQRLGRVLRPAPGKRVANIYTIYATDVEEARLRQEASTLTGVAEVQWSRVTIPT